MGDADVDRVRLLRAGDSTAWRDLARGLGLRLRALAMKHFASPFEQEEAIQEALLHAFKAREQIDPLRMDTLEGWVMTLAEHRMIDLRRAASVRPPSAGAVERNEDEPVELRAERTPEDDAREAELHRVVVALEEKLKPAWRAYFRAVFVEGRDFDEARESLGIGALRAKYLKRVLMARLRGHRPLLEVLGRRSG